MQEGISVPTVSVIMATYNCEQTIKCAINSIINQTYKDWELVVCDDCSTDSTYQILEEYQQIYQGKVIIVRNDINSKLPYSLNHCLKYASGKYIARMDGDDISVPERLERQVEFLDKHPEESVVGTSMIRFDETGDYGVYEAEKSPDRYTLLHGVPFCHATIMMRKEAYDSLNGYTVSKRTERGQDVDLWFRFFAKGYSGKNIMEPLYKVCEDRAAIKRRKLKYSLYMTHTRLLGFKMLNYPVRKYIYAFLPIISFLLPRKLKILIRNNKG